MTLPPTDRPLLDDYDNPDDYPTDLTTAARAEVVHLWSDLAEARRNANRGCWSMGCENVAYRIVMLSRIVGATDSGEIDVDVVLDGLYERLHREAGIVHPPIDWDGIREARAYIERSVAEVRGPR